MSSSDVIVIGGGQAGLAAAHHLQRTGLSFVVLEAGAQVGGSWPHHYDSLTLFSPARYSRLPGLAMDGDQDRYPTRDEMVAYLRRYAEHVGVPVRTGARVESVRWLVDRHEVVLGGGDRLEAQAVIAATGSFTTPVVPSIDGADGFGGRLLHVSRYRRPGDLAGQRVLVVGAGNSAVQVAAELAEVAHVSLATRAPVRFRAQAPLGRDIHWWLDRTGIERLPLRSSGTTTTPVLDTGRYRAALASGRPDRRPMFERFTPDGVRWQDGSTEAVDTVVFATGYRPSLGYLPEVAFSATGWPAHRDGTSTTVPNLGFVGLPGQRGIASATVRGVGPDAERVVRSLARRLVHTTTPEGSIPWLVARSR